jgi:flagellar basal-body rod protein FlgB
MSPTPITGKLDQALSVQSTALALRVQRQQALASNIANADTPGYKAVDFDFTRALRNATGGTQAVAAQQAASAPAVTAAGHQQGSRSAYAGLSTDYTTQYRMPAQPSADGNSVDMDLERARFAENSVKYEAALKFLNGQIKTLLSAIQG